MHVVGGHLHSQYTFYLILSPFIVLSLQLAYIDLVHDMSTAACLNSILDGPYLFWFLPALHMPVYCVIGDGEHGASSLFHVQ